MPAHRPVVQIVAGLVGAPESAVDTAQVARNAALAWVAAQRDVVLPTQAFSGESFDIDIADGTPVAAERFRDYWALQFDKFDPEVAGRVWRSEISIAYSAAGASAGLRLSVIDIASGLPFSTSVPRLILDWARRPGLSDYGVIVGELPDQVRSAGDVRRMVNLIRQPERTRPVVVFSSGDGHDATEDAALAARRLTGLAHVYHLPPEFTGQLTEMLGRDFSVWRGAVRTYHTGCDPRRDHPSRHPIATRGWIARRFGGIDRFIWVLLRSFADVTVRGGALEEALPSLRTIRQASLSERIAALPRGAAVAGEREQLLELEVAELKRAVEDAQGYATYAEQVQQEAEEERDRYRWQVSALRTRIGALEVRLGAPMEVPISGSFDGLAAWVAEHFADRIQLLSRAIRAVGKSSFNEPALVYRCLQWLATDYVTARRQGLPVGDPFETLGVRLERTGDPARLAQWREQYFFPLRGKDEFLEWHLTRGKDHADETCLRVYFYYDDEDEIVIVGHLPGHLTNEAS